MSHSALYRNDEGNLELRWYETAADAAAVAAELEGPAVITLEDDDDQE